MDSDILIKDKSVGLKLMYKEVMEGLSKSRKELPCKYFYDERGSKLFDEICTLDEYYVTRTELSIMHDNFEEMSDVMGEKLMFVEYGSGSSDKIKIILDHVKGICTYVPIDISCSHLAKSAAQIAAKYKHLEVIPVCADYNKEFLIPEPKNTIDHKIVYFPGSTIGNFHRDEALKFLSRIAKVSGQNGGLLIGVDLKKDTSLLNNAYNDSRGVTAEFNLNQLKRFNKELGSNFNLDDFRHDAFYNKKEGRMEMHLISKKDQTVKLNGSIISFNKDESIWTESSYKYSLDEFKNIANDAGFSVENVWIDEAELFSVQYLTVDS
ncbi:MAG: L-histidine N(alpha)-methyltransferase [Calditrichaeota bacterium]|nr:MAG: L-histidine N(alpha)-methyltransferase [Calditrichota bacterium]MBL1205289.1 L-histidine N(alpha)-methyltransferase [Calditrichota bacterium]NOG45118.1 L-histidine N(alpha)-methyltransferase [Calditrichota bacterium]